MTTRKRGSAPTPVFYTTHQVAGILGVSLATVVNWVKQGRMRAHRTPGGHRRISRAELARFSRENDYPLPLGMQVDELPLEGGPPRVLLVHSDSAFAEVVRDYLRLQGEVDVAIADRGLQAGFRLASLRPQVVMLDLGLADVSPVQLARLAAEQEPPPLVLGCTTLRGADSDRLVAEGLIQGVVERSTDVAELVRRIRALLPAPGPLSTGGT